MVPGEGLTERVDRRGADVAEHDSDRAHGHLKERALVSVRYRIMVRGGRYGGSSRGDVHVLRFRLDDRDFTSLVPEPSSSVTDALH